MGAGRYTDMYDDRAHFRSQSTASSSSSPVRSSLRARRDVYNDAAVYRGRSERDAHDVDEEIDISGEGSRGNGDTPAYPFHEDEWAPIRWRDMFSDIGGSLFGRRGERLGGFLGDMGSIFRGRMHNYDNDNGRNGDRGRMKGFYAVTSVERKYLNGELESEVAMYDINGNGETRAMKRDLQTGEEKVVYKKHHRDGRTTMKAIEGRRRIEVSDRSEEGRDRGRNGKKREREIERRRSSSGSRRYRRKSDERSRGSHGRR